MRSTFHRLNRPLSSILGFSAVLILANLSSGLFAQTAPATPVYRWTTLAGRATTGFDDGPGPDARFNNPHGVALDASGNIYIADTANHTIRKISAPGVVSTLAGSPNQPGSADGTGSTARFTLPEGVAVDAAGNVYVADTGNYTVRKITPDGVVTTLAGQAGQRGSADGPANTACFTNPVKIFADATGNVYVIDNGLRRIASGTVETIALTGQVVAGNGETVGVAPRGGLAVDASGQIYFSAGPGTGSGGWKRIIKRDASGAWSILASSVGSDNKPFVSDQTSEVAMTTDSAGNLYFVSQLISSVIDYSLYKISPAGALSRPNWRGLARGGYLDSPLGLAADAAERIIHTVSSDDVILQNNPQTFSVFAGTPWSGQGVDGTGTSARFSTIAALTVDRSAHVLVGDAQLLYHVHHTGGAVLRKISPARETTTLYSGPVTQSPPQTSTGVALGTGDNVILGVFTALAEFRQIAPDGTASNLASGSFRQMNAMASDSTGRLLVADRDRRVHRRSVAGEWSVLAGANQPAEIKDGDGDAARFSEIIGLCVAPDDDAYVLDRVSTPELRVVIRRIKPNGNVTTVGANLVKAANISPTAIAFDAKNDFLLTYSDDTVRLLSAGGTEFIIGGSPLQSGARDGDGQDARFYQPAAITTDAQNSIFLADNAKVTVRKGEFLGYNASISSHPQSLTVAAGASAQFSVTAAGTPAPTYQWQFAGTAITGATGSTLTLSNVTTANAGDYTVVVTNSLGSVTSNKATLTVTAAPVTPPPPAPSGGGGGGGAPSAWFFLVLSAATGLRFARALRSAAVSAAR